MRTTEILNYYGTKWRGRWVVRILDRGNDLNGLGEPVRAYHRYSAAKRYAIEHAHDHRDGLVVQDVRLRLIDVGSCWITLRGEDARTPSYAVAR